MKKIKDIKNNLLKRREVELELEADSNPGYENIKKMISTELKAKEDSIVIKTLKGQFGSKIFKINALVYDSKEDLDKVEQKARVKKGAEGAAVK